MSIKIYVDANIYLDYFFDRRDGIRPLAEFAYNIFRRALECEFEIIMSRLIVIELEVNALNYENFAKFFSTYLKKGKISYYDISEEELNSLKAAKNSNDHIHALLAQKAGCEFLVTRNIPDFLRFSNLVPPRLPEEI